MSEAPGAAPAARVAEPRAQTAVCRGRAQRPRHRGFAAMRTKRVRRDRPARQRTPPTTRAGGACPRGPGVGTPRTDCPAAGAVTVTPPATPRRRPRAFGVLTGPFGLKHLKPAFSSCSPHGDVLAGHGRVPEAERLATRPVGSGLSSASGTRSDTCVVCPLVFTRGTLSHCVGRVPELPGRARVPHGREPGARPPGVSPAAPGGSRVSFGPRVLRSPSGRTCDTALSTRTAFPALA